MLVGSGRFLANSLEENFDVTIVELGAVKFLLQDHVKDISNPAVTYLNIC